VGPNGLLAADTYNDKIKRIDVAHEAKVSTWYAGRGELALREPAGLSQLENGQVVVADTNHHRLVVIDADRRRARVLALRE
jgi:hypothetical protein